MSDRRLWALHHAFSEIEVEPGCTDSVSAGDSDLVDRIMRAYRRSDRARFYGEGSFWRVQFDEKQRAIDELIRHGSRDQVAAMLRDPKSNYLLYGFEMIFRDAYERGLTQPEQRQKWAAGAKRQLARLAEAIGALRIENPEGGPWLENVHRPTEDLIDKIERALGFKLAVPWFWDGLFGIKTRRGIFGQRMIHVAFCAHRLRQLGARRVLELGAGLGHLARYCWSIGIDYTIVDLPMTNVAQAYFLGRTVGSVQLEGEPPTPGAIRILTPEHLEAGERYDVVANVDGLTEMGLETGRRYFDHALAHAPVFWSVNHEANAFTVAELAKGLMIERFPFWMRRGYVEEIVRRR